MTLTEAYFQQHTTDDGRLLLSNKDLDDIDCSAIAAYLTTHQEIWHVDLSQNNLLSFSEIAALDTITELNLAYNDLDVWAFLEESPEDTALCTLANNQHLKKLDLSHTLLTDEFTAYLVRHNRSIETLNISNTAVSFETLKMLQINDTIKYLDISNNNLGKHAGMLLAGQASIVGLDISGNSIGDEGVSYLAHNRLIKEVALQCCGITDEGAIALLTNNSIHKISLKGNQISDFGALALTQKDDLTVLDLRDNQVGPVVKEYLGNESPVKVENKKEKGKRNAPSLYEASFFGARNNCDKKDIVGKHAVTREQEDNLKAVMSKTFYM